MNRSDLSFLESIFQKPLDEIDASVLVVNQSKRHKIQSDFSNITVINDSKYGLSRSRNIALKNAIAKYVWILDDDVVILKDAMEIILKAVGKNPSYAAWTFKIITPDSIAKRNYASNSFSYRPKDLQRGPSSIEIVLDREQLLRENIWFNEHFGLGTQFPMGEEGILFKSLLQNGKKAIFIPEYIVEHLFESSGSDPASDKFIYVKGALAAMEGNLKALYLNYKYTFFLWRKGFVRSLSELKNKHRIFKRGIEDFNRLS